MKNLPGSASFLCCHPQKRAHECATKTKKRFGKNEERLSDNRLSQRKQKSPSNKFSSFVGSYVVISPAAEFIVRSSIVFDIMSLLVPKNLYRSRLKVKNGCHKVSLFCASFELRILMSGALKMPLCPLLYIHRVFIFVDQKKAIEFDYFVRYKPIPSLPSSHITTRRFGALRTISTSIPIAFLGTIVLSNPDLTIYLFKWWNASRKCFTIIGSISYDGTMIASTILQGWGYMDR